MLQIKQSDFLVPLQLIVSDSLSSFADVMMKTEITVIFSSDIFIITRTALTRTLKPIIMGNMINLLF